MNRNNIPAFFLLGFLLIMLPFLIILVQKAQKFLSRAAFTPANIIVDAKTIFGPMPKPWTALTQGGEADKEKMLNSTVSLVKPLTPKYIRIDHLYDFYDVVNRDSTGKLTFNFSKLDLIVNDILATGGKPMFSLSYMPPAISSGNITSPPNNWLDWQEIVRQTVEHYSSRNSRNLSDVAYEVWNEPDLFGKWSINNYELLYSYSVKGASLAQNTNPFKIGGPATTAFYKNWLNEFIKYVYDNNLRLDFFSWHKYSLSPQDFLTDINFIDSLLSSHGGSYLLPKFITEWGSDPDVNQIHDSQFDAAHTVAVIRQILDRVDLVFSFEIKDGKDPNGKSFWGRWGIISFDNQPKLRYFALKLLNQLNGQRLKLTGEGSFITGIATKNGDKIQILLVNYDQEGKHDESFPVNIIGLTPGNYQFSQTDLLGKITGSTETASADSFSKIIFLPANSLVLLELSPSI